MYNIYIYVHIYMYIYVCVRLCVFIHPAEVYVIEPAKEERVWVNTYE